MEETNKKRQETHSSALTASVKREMITSVLETQQRGDSLQTRTGMTPSGHNNFFPWIPIPLDQPVVPQAAAPLFNERRYEILVKQDATDVLCY